MKYLLYAIALCGLLWGIQYLVTFLQLCKLRLQFTRYRLRPGDRAPAYLQKLLQQPLNELTELGFERHGYLQVKPMVKLHPPSDWQVLLYHKPLKTYAKIGIRRPVEPVDLFDIEFYTFFKDKSLLVTLNSKGHGVIGTIPNTVAIDPYAATTAAQWQAHQDKLEAIAATKTPCGISPAWFAKTLQANERQYLESLRDSGTIVATAEPKVFRLASRTALQTTRALKRGEAKAAKRLKQRRQQVKTQPVELPVELEVEGFLRAEQLQRGLVGRKVRTALFFVSVGAFIAAYANWFAPHYLALLLGVLLLHEGGHLLVMKLCGYGDTSMLFIPFLGAVATARQKDDATLSQKFWVLLAGPLPGLIFGVGLAIATRNGSYPQWLQEAAWMLVGLNFFNLLPIYPLDGGQVAELLLFSRLPYLGVLFKVFGVGCLVWIGLSQPLFFLFAPIILLSIPSSFRAARVNTRLRRELRHHSTGDRPTLLHAIFAHLRKLGYGKLSTSNRHLLVRGLVQSHRELQGQWATRIALVVLYVGSLLAGTAGSLHLFFPNWLQASQPTPAPFVAAAQQEIERATALLRLNPNNVEAYRQRAQARTALHDYKRAMQDYTQALHLAPQNVQIYYDRAVLYSLSGQYQNAIADYSEGIKLNPQDEMGYVRRGYIQQKLGDYNNALADINTALELNPNEPRIYRLRSQVRRLIGDEKGAIADEQKAQTLYQN